MKKIVQIISVALLLLQTTSLVSFAASSKPSPTPNQSITQIEQQINNLKDKIASRVAQLKLVEKRGIIGIVTDVSETQITLKDIQGNVHFVDVDELTKFSSPSVKSNFGISDITKNTTLGVLGLYNKESRRILSRFVDVMTTPTYIEGAIVAIDKTNYTITVVEQNTKQTIVEIEDVTKITSFDKAAGITKFGFSKMLVGQRIHIVGYPDKQNTKELIASRVIVFPTVPINPAIGTQIPQTPDASPTPSVSVKKTAQ